MSLERRPNIHFTRGEDDCEPFLGGAWGYLNFYRRRIERTTFFEARRQGLLETLVAEVRKHDNIVRTLEIGANTGRAIQPTMEFFATSLPSDVFVEMHCIDCNDYNVQDIELPSEMPENFSLTYHTQTEASAFLFRTNVPFSLIYGFAIDFLIQPETFIGEPAFVEFLREHANRVILPGGLLIFRQGRSKFNSYGVPIKPLLPEEEYTEYAQEEGVNIIQRKVDLASKED